MTTSVSLFIVTLLVLSIQAPLSTANSSNPIPNTIDRSGSIINTLTANHTTPVNDQKYPTSLKDPPTTGPSNTVSQTEISGKLNIASSNVPPKVSLSIRQNGRTGYIIQRNGGPLQLRVHEIATFPGESYHYRWILPPKMSISKEFPNAIEISTVDLEIGIYHVAVIATDDGSPALSKIEQKIVRVVNNLPANGSSVNSSSDDNQSNQNSINSFIPFFLDRMRRGTLIPIDWSIKDRYYIEGFLGQKVGLGLYNIGLGSLGVRLNQREYAHLSATQNLAFISLKPSDLLVNLNILDILSEVNPPDQFFSNPSSVTSRSQRSKNSAVKSRIGHFSIPLIAELDFSSEIFSYHPTAGWQRFNLREGNNLVSSKGDNGFCPSPVDQFFRRYMQVEDNCLRVSIRDGGSNDLDGEVNGEAQVMLLIRTDGNGDGSLIRPLPSDADDSDSEGEIVDSNLGVLSTEEGFNLNGDSDDDSSSTISGYPISVNDSKANEENGFSNLNPYDLQESDSNNLDFDNFSRTDSIGNSDRTQTEAKGLSKGNIDQSNRISTNGYYSDLKHNNNAIKSDRQLQSHSNSRIAGESDDQYYEYGGDLAAAGSDISVDHELQDFPTSNDTQWKIIRWWIMAMLVILLTTFAIMWARRQ